MRSVRALSLAVCLLLNSTTEARPRDFCDLLLRKAGFSREESLTKARRLAREAEGELDKDFRAKGYGRRAARGYAILVAAMVGSAALTTYLTASLPANFQFLSQFLAQVSTLGVYVLGAPIWEPIASRFRKFSFGVRDLAQDPQPPGDEPWLLHQWDFTQRRFSLNEQMSRNLVGGNINVLSVNFNLARDQRRLGDDKLAASQIAEAAYRQRTIYDDILPTNRSVAAMIWTTFSDHCAIDQTFVQKVWDMLSKLDHEVATEKVHAYYELLLKTWFNPEWAKLEPSGVGAA